MGTKVFGVDFLLSALFPCPLNNNSIAKITAKVNTFLCKDCVI